MPTDQWGIQPMSSARDPYKRTDNGITGYIFRAVSAAYITMATDEESTFPRQSGGAASDTWCTGLLL